MTPENYISTDPGSEQDFVDKRINEVAQSIAMQIKKANDNMEESMMANGLNNKLTGIIGAADIPIHENLMIDWEKLEGGN